MAPARTLYFPLQLGFGSDGQRRFRVSGFRGLRVGEKDKRENEGVSGEELTEVEPPSSFFFFSFFLLLFVLF